MADYCYDLEWVCISRKGCLLYISTVILLRDINLAEALPY